MQLAVESATRLLRARYGAIGILDESDQYKDFVFSGLPVDQTRLIASTASDHGVTGGTDHEQCVGAVPNSAEAARMHGIPAILVAQDALAVPVFSLGRAWGRLYVSSRVDEAPFTNLDKLLAAHFAQYLSLALDRRHQIELYQEKEAGYHQGEDRYRLLLDMAPGAVLVLQGGVVQMANAPAMQIAGTTLLSDLVGRSIDDLLHPDHVSRAKERIVQVTTRPSPAAENGTAHAPAGRPLWLDRDRGSTHQLPGATSHLDRGAGHHEGKDGQHTHPRLAAAHGNGQSRRLAQPGVRRCACHLERDDPCRCARDSDVQQEEGSALCRLERHRGYVLRRGRRPCAVDT